MSVHAMAWVWDHSRSAGTDRLVLLAIADNANSDGTEAWPSNAELCRKTGLSERGVQLALSRLKMTGELQVDVNAGPRGVNRYTMPLRRPPHDVHPAQDAPPHDVHPPAPTTPADDAPPPPQEMHPTPAPGAPVTVLEPSSTTTTALRAARPSEIREGEIETGVQALVREWIDGYPQRPPDRFIGQTARKAKQLADAGYTRSQVAGALRLLRERALHPSTLDSLMAEVIAPPAPRKSARAQQTEDAITGFLRRQGAM